MSYADDVMKHYNQCGADLRKRLAAVLDDAENTQAGRPVAKRSAKDSGEGPGVKSGAMASESAPAPAFVRPDVALAAAADALMLSEDFTGDYGAAMNKALADDPDLAKRYHEQRFGAPDTTPRSERPDVQLAEASKKIAEERSIPYGAAMAVALAEDPALAKRYHGA